ncbi:putative NAD(P)-binding protein [Nonlabens xylanidelens]|uniref:Putative NAD(P)-binding protein n=1 Tax=Nonlabens xylanidelens TaxID=191564 RepID=A0A2S6IQW3_9FLAO|nr:NAD(P)H-binding protein [Nonlabens xylanidelens]PPK96545.1 putative NAD(P)-binding protein [Nonlabens xylanidelens]PQJ13268.1 nucleoside-diphosphate sugar epimerase [Nonlabens xylanidelens]
MGYTGIIIGATGLTGTALVSQLLEDEKYDRIITLSRKQITNNHPKHENHIADLFDPQTYQEQLKGDHLFICTGTTQSKTPDKEEYYRIEHDLPIQVAQVALKNGVSKVVAISALGASPDSKFIYNRGKGDMERDIEALGFQESYFVQPALIGGKRDEKRLFESAMKKIQKLIDPLLFGFLKKYRTIEPETIASAMIYVAINGYDKVRIESDELKTVVSRSF